MKLYLVQHGQAQLKESDPDRSLSEAGIIELKKILDFLDSHISLHVSAIYHSGKTRARQTAEYLADHIKLDNKPKETDGLAPMDDPVIWAEKLKKITDDIMLAGHLPHLSRLTGLLVGNSADLHIVDFHNGGIVCLVRDENNHWSISWIMIPEILN